MPGPSTLRASRSATSRRMAVSNLEPAECDALLDRDVSAALAFADVNGHPRIVPCWFLWDGSAFYVSSLAEKFHVRSLMRDPRASLCVEVEEVERGRGGFYISTMRRDPVWSELQYDALAAPEIEYGARNPALEAAKRS